MFIKWLKFLGLLVLALVGISVFVVGVQEPPILVSPWTSIFELLGGTILGACLSPIWQSFVDLRDNTSWKTSQRKLLRGNFINSESNIRISFAYLFRIKVNGKYFLIKNERGTGKFQPVGGVYKMTQDEANFLHQHYQAEDDNCIKIDQSSKMDYRLRIKSKNLRKFFKRFDKTNQRESYRNLYREFEEELVNTGLLDRSNFSCITYRFIGRHISEVRYEEHFQCYEILLADIFEILLTSEQEKQFEKLQAVSSKKYCFATDEDINQLGVHPGTQDLQETIADHSAKILIQGSTDLKANPRYPHGSITATEDEKFRFH